MAKTLYINVTQIITNAGVHLKRGVAVESVDLGIIEDAAMLWDSRTGIEWMGRSKALPTSVIKSLPDKNIINLSGHIISPALVDAHTHLVFAGSRHREMEQRIAGATYEEIAAKGGGIRSTVSATRNASEEELFRLGVERVQTLRRLGVGVVEMKSGYGLDWPNERKILRVIQRLKKRFSAKVSIFSTFLGAHAFPEWANNGQKREEYVKQIIEEMLPQVAREGLADSCDVFFDRGYFDREQSIRILTCAKNLGLSVKIHADELSDAGGAALAAELGALSADHLLLASEEGLKAMAHRGVVAVLLPTTALVLGVPYASIQKVRRAGLCPALATDFNPGSSPCQHLPFVMSLACLAGGFTMAEAFAAATYGGARALGCEAHHGHLEVGMVPRISIFRVESYEQLISQIAHPSLCVKVI